MEIAHSLGLTQFLWRDFQTERNISLYQTLVLTFPAMDEIVCNFRQGSYYQEILTMTFFKVF